MTVRDFLEEWNGESPYIRVHTSGSTGQPKELRVERSRMLASARMTCDYLSLRRGDVALLCLPLEFIAGKMMVVRSLERGMQLLEVTPSAHPLARDMGHIDFAAMVPSQVYETLREPAEKARLAEIGNIIIGGGILPAGVEQELRSFPNAIYCTYGMTETLSHIAMRRVSGEHAADIYTPMDGVTLSLTDCEDDRHTVGRLVIDAPHLCSATLVTNDIVQMAGRGFRVIGRTDNVICSGGIKLHIEQLEEQLRPHMPCPFCITGQPHPKLGEAAVLMAESEPPLAGHLTEVIRSVCRRHLPRYAVPRTVIAVPRLPLTANGKPDRAAARRMVQTGQPTLVAEL